MIGYAVFAAVAGVVFALVSIAMAAFVGYVISRSKFEQRQSNTFTSINRAIAVLTSAEIDIVRRSAPDKVIGLLQAAKAKIAATQHKAQGDEAARAAEFKA